MFIKLVGGRVEPGPNPLIIQVNIDGVKSSLQVYNPTDEDYTQAGYKELVEGPCPDVSDKYFIKEYVEEDDCIRVVWVEADPPEETEVESPIVTLSNKIFTAETELTDVQLALCELYEMMIG